MPRRFIPGAAIVGGVSSRARVHAAVASVAALAAKEKSSQPKKQTTSGQVLRLAKKGPPTAAELQANMAKFRDQL